MTHPIVKPASPPPPPAKSSAQAPVLPPAVKSVPGDRAVTGLIYGLYCTMVVLAGLSLYLVFEVILPVLRPPPELQPCREDVANECGEGKYCRQGTCNPVPNQTCNEGDPCSDACSCLAPSSCGAEQICRAPDSPPPPKCTEEMKTFVAELLEHQKNCEAIAGGPLSSCLPQNVQSFMLAHDKFDVLLNDFGSSLVFMFPSGRPSLDDGERRDPWNDETTRSRYLELARGQGDALRRAKHLIIVGRATRDNRSMDYAYAQSRVRFAREALLDAIAGTKEEGKATARSEMSAKFIEFALGSDRQLQLEFYRSNLRVPTAWWDKNASRELTTALTKLELNTPVSPRERGEAETLINRSVAIFAIPPECVKGQ